MAWRDGSTIPADYRDTPAPPFGVDEYLDRMAYVLCEYGGHIPNHKPDTAEQTCEFHRRMAQAYITYAKTTDDPYAKGTGAWICGESGELLWRDEDGGWEHRDHSQCDYSEWKRNGECIDCGVDTTKDFDDPAVQGCYANRGFGHRRVVGR